MTSIMTLAVTILLLFVYKEASVKQHKDMLEKEIFQYGNRSLDYIQRILTDASAIVERSPNSSGFKSYRVSFNDVKTKNQEGSLLSNSDKNWCKNTLEGTWIESGDAGANHRYYSCIQEREVRITLDPYKGFVFTINNKDVTPSLLKLSGNSFQPAGDGFTPFFVDVNQDSKLIQPYTQYIIGDWGIDPIESGDLYDRIASSKQSALSESSYKVWLEINIQNLQSEDWDEKTFDKDLIQTKRFEKTAFSPYVYISRQTSSSKSI